MKAKNENCMEERIEVTAYILWQTWKARNDWQFQREEGDAAVIIEKVAQEWQEYLKVVK